MKREGLLRHPRRYGCVLRREGKENPRTGHAEALPRHAEIPNLLARKICRKLSIPDPPGWISWLGVYGKWRLNQSDNGIATVWPG